MKILFQGDSITDAGRDRKDSHNLAGYSKIVAEQLIKKYPNEDFEFINLGISGNRTIDLIARYDEDFEKIQPDIVSLMIGINDVWHYKADPIKFIGAEGYRDNLLYILQRLKNDTNAKILLLEPYLLPAADKQAWKMDVCAIIEQCRGVATLLADEYIPLDGIFAKECVNQPWQIYSADGVHPTPKGEELIAKYYVEEVSKIIDEIIIHSLQIKSQG